MTQLTEDSSAKSSSPETYEAVKTTEEEQLQWQEVISIINQISLGVKWLHSTHSTTGSNFFIFLQVFLNFS